jgi:hypothetical protein
MNRASRLSGLRKDVLAIIVLFAIPAAFLSPVLLTDRVLVGDSMARYIPWDRYEDVDSLGPLNEDYADTLLAYYPQILVAREIVRSGSLPLWNPYTLSGVPFLAAAPWLGFFYAPYLLFYVLDPLKVLGYLALLQMGLAGAFTYLYVRSIACHRLASLLGALSFGFGGFLLANVPWLPRVSTVIWVPLLFLSVERVLVKGTYAYALVGALATAMCVLAGNLAATVYVLLAGALYFVFRLVALLRSKAASLAGRRAAVLGIAILLGGMASAVQLIPTWEVSKFTQRLHVTYDERAESGRSLIALATLAVPDIFGNPVDRPWGRNEFETNIPGTYGETSLYVGIMPLSLAAWAMIRRRDAHTAFFGGLALFGIFLFLNTGLFRVLYLLPPFRIGRQVEARILWAFACSVLVGLGSEALLGDRSGPSRRARRVAAIGLLCVGAVVVAGLGLGSVLLRGRGSALGESIVRLWYAYNVGNFVRLALLAAASAAVFWLSDRHRIGTVLVAAVAAAVIVGDMALFGWKLHPFQHPDVLYPQTESASFLQADQDVFRVIRGPLSRKVYPPNSLAVYGIPDVQGYSPVLIDYYVEFMQVIEEDIASTRRVYSLRNANSVRSPLLDLLNAKYVISIADPGTGLDALDGSAGELHLVYDGEVDIYQNTDALPRAFFVSGYEVLDSDEELLRELSSEDFQPAATVLLDHEPAPLPETAEEAPVQTEVRMVQYTADRVSVEANLAQDGFLLLGDLYYPGWKALVDGVEQEVYRADYALRAVRLRAGSHSVDFVFEPSSFRWGVAVSLAGLSGIVGLAAVVERRRIKM